MKNKKEIRKKSKKKLIGLALSILFTLIVPLGFVFVMGFLSESFPALYYYTKQIFIGFIVLLVLGICMIIYQIYRYIKMGKNNVDDERIERRERRKEERRKQEQEESMMKNQRISS